MMKKVIDDWPLTRAQFTFGELRAKPGKESKLFIWTNSSKALIKQKKENEMMSKELKMLKQEARLEDYASKKLSRDLLNKQLEYTYKMKEYERNREDYYTITNSKDEEAKESLKDFDEKMLENSKFLKEFEENNDISINRYNIPKNIHGFSAFKLSEDIIAFTLHSSKSNFSLFGIEMENLEVEETLNPIKYVNPIHFMKIKDFLEVFDVYGPEKMLSAQRYGVNEDYDLAYCALRAGIRSMQTSKTAVVVTGEDAIKKISIENKIQIDEDGMAIMPALAKAEECDPEYIAKIVEESLALFSEIDNNIDAKKRVLGQAGEVFKDIESIGSKGDSIF